MKKKYFIIITIFLTAGLINVKCVNTKVYNSNITPSSPFEWGYDLDTIVNHSNTIIDSTALHPLDIGRKAYFLTQRLKKHEKHNTIAIQKALKYYLDLIVSYPFVSEDEKSKVYLYPFNHKNFNAKEWWSGMANSVIALACLESYYLFNDTTYYIEYEKALYGTINHIKDNGSTLKLDNDSEWIMEYATKNTSLDNGYFVLNGNLFALLAIDQMRKIEKTKELEEFYNSGVSAFNSLKHRFYFKDTTWTNYMLNPITIESVHYAVYDILLLQSLYISTPQNIFQEEMKKRQVILKNHFPIYITQENDSINYHFSYIGAPHPYWIDLYPVTLNYFKNGILCKSKELVKPKDFSIPISQRAFNLDSFSHPVDSIEVYVHYGDYRLKLYSYHSYELERIEKRVISDIGFTTSTLRSTRKKENNLFEIVRDSLLNTRGTIRILPEKKVSLDPLTLIGINISNKVEINNILITLIDSSNNSVTRYYIPMNKENNLIVLNRIGFKNAEKFNYTAIKEIRLDLFIQSDLLEKNNQIIVPAFLIFKNHIELHHYFLNNPELNFPEKKAKGNIY